MREARINIEGMAPLSMSRYIAEKRGTNEAADQFEERSWRERCNALEDGSLYIPPMACKHMLVAAAKFLGQSIPGKRNATWTKRFTMGLLSFEPVVITPTVTKDTVEGEWLFVPSDGKPGGGSRVAKCFPVIRNWGGTVVIQVIDDVIKNSVLEDHVEAAGKFVGLGRFRPERNGFYGRFKVNKVQWS